VETDFQYRRINTVMNAFGNICNTLPLHNIITIQKLCLLPPFFVTVIWDKVPQLHWCYYFTTKDNYLFLSSSTREFGSGRWLQESPTCNIGHHRAALSATTAATTPRTQGDEFSRQVKKRDNVVA